MLKALILSGGDKFIKGLDTSLYDYKGKTPICFIYETLLQFKLDIYISVTPSQVDEYASRFPREKLIVDEFDYASGAVKGIVSAHKSFPEADWLVLSCKDPEVSASNVASLMYRAKRHSDKDFFLLEDGTDSVRPFPAVFKGEFLKWMYNFYLVGKLQTEDKVSSFYQHGKKLIIRGSESESVNLQQYKKI